MAQARSLLEISSWAALADAVFRKADFGGHHELKHRLLARALARTLRPLAPTLGDIPLAVAQGMRSSARRNSLFDEKGAYLVDRCRSS